MTYRIDRRPVTRPHLVARILSVICLAVIVFAMVTKDTGMVHGTANPAAMYCTALRDQLVTGGLASTETPENRDECIRIFDDLDPADQLLLIEIMGRG